MLNNLLERFFMTIPEMKELKVGDICKDVEVSGNYGRDVFCKIIKVEDDRIEIISVKDDYALAYPVVLFYRTCSWKLENI